MNVKIVAYCLIAVEFGVQVLGIFNDQIPEVVWSFANAILIMVPLVFGIKLGLVCMIPFAASEIFWSCKLQAAGPLLHLVSFGLAIVILGLANRKIMQMPRLKRTVVSGVLLELFLIGEEVLYYGLRMLVLQKPFSWDDISGTFLSPANLVMLIVLILCCVYYSGPKGEKQLGVE
ncbi:MAG: hypothetical protein IJH04_04325 [Eggerthellaceae bacterium]|nr:hypothetical protein [Eggerthellaceae bacterium]